MNVECGWEFCMQVLAIVSKDGKRRTAMDWMSIGRSDVVRRGCRGYITLIRDAEGLHRGG